MAGAIVVTAVTAASAHARQALISRLLAPCADDSDVSAIVLAPSGDLPGLAFARTRALVDTPRINRGDCPCCTMRTGLARVLRECFMDALSRRSAPFKRIVVSCATAEDAAPVMHTLRYDPFLNDRYLYGGCIAVLGTASPMRDMMRQAALADALVIPDGQPSNDLLQALSTAGIDAPLYSLAGNGLPAAVGPGQGGVLSLEGLGAGSGAARLMHSARASLWSGSNWPNGPVALRAYRWCN